MAKERFTTAQLEEHVRQAIGLVQSAESGIPKGKYHIEGLGKRFRFGVGEKMNYCIQAGAYTVMEQAAKELTEISDWESAKKSLAKMNMGLENISDTATVGSISRLCVVINDQAEQKNKESVQDLSKTLVEIASSSGEFWRRQCESRGF